MTSGKPALHLTEQLADPVEVLFGVQPEGRH
jgi:hypothetical protein